MKKYVSLIVRLCVWVLQFSFCHYMLHNYVRLMQHISCTSLPSCLSACLCLSVWLTFRLCVCVAVFLLPSCAAQQRATHAAYACAHRGGERRSKRTVRPLCADAVFSLRTGRWRWGGCSGGGEELWHDRRTTTSCRAGERWRYVPATV